MSGATDWYECRTRTRAGTCRCEPKCKVCGWGKHMAVHGPFFGKPPGSKPYDHEFEPLTPATDAGDKVE